MYNEIKVFIKMKLCTESLINVSLHYPMGFVVGSPYVMYDAFVAAKMYKPKRMNMFTISL